MLSNFFLKHLKRERNAFKLFGISSSKQRLTHRVGPIAKNLLKKTFLVSKLFGNFTNIIASVPRGSACVIEVTQFYSVVTHSRALELPITDDFKATRSVAKFSRFVAKFPANISQFVAQFLTKYAG